MDRRGIFFVVAAAFCALLIPAAPRDLAWVPRDVAIAYLVLAGLSFADHVSHRREDRPPRHVNRTAR